MLLAAARARLAGAANALWEAVGSPPVEPERVALERDVARLRDVLGDDFVVLWEQDRQMTPDQATAYALGRGIALDDA